MLNSSVISKYGKEEGYYTWKEDKREAAFAWVLKFHKPKGTAI